MDLFSNVGGMYSILSLIGFCLVQLFKKSLLTAKIIQRLYVIERDDNEQNKKSKTMKSNKIGLNSEIEGNITVNHNQASIFSNENLDLTKEAIDLELKSN